MKTETASSFLTLNSDMTDMDVDPPAPSTSKKGGKDDGKKRFEVKKVRI